MVVVGALGYYLGVMREHHNRTRDMVVDHYVETHPTDFERLNDSKFFSIHAFYDFEINHFIFSLWSSFLQCSYAMVSATN